MHKMGKKINVIKDYQNYVYYFYCKQHKLAEPQKTAHGTQRFCRTQFEGHTLKVRKWCCMEAIQRHTTDGGDGIS